MQSKQEFLEKQFPEHSFDIVGIQEGRSRSSGLKEGSRYKRVAASAYDDGSCGVQIWIRKSLRAELVHWQVVCPRIVHAVVKLRNGANVVIVCGHAPQSGNLESVKDEFWAQLWDLCTQLKTSYPSAHFVLPIDANGRVGSVQSESLGSCQPDKENDGGCRLRMFAESFHFRAANTWWNAGPTWCSSRGYWHRIDYVLVDESDLSEVLDAMTYAEIDLTFNASADHIPVGVKLRVEPHECQLGDDKSDLPRGNSFKVNKFNLADPVRCQNF